MNNKEQCFFVKIREIHGLTSDFNPLITPPPRKSINPQNVILPKHQLSMNELNSYKEGIRHREFQALTETFLGNNYDPEKLQSVEQEQINLDVSRSELIKQYKLKQLNPEEYVDRVNELIRNTFNKIEKILGQQDFVKLFGGSPENAGGYIDKDLFSRNSEGTEV